MSDLLFEIGTEEIPARFMTKALHELAEHAKALFIRSRLECKTLKTMGTDRRLALIVTGLSEKQADLDQELKGPPKRIAVDAEGKFTQAALGFAKKSNIAPEKLSFQKFGNEEYLFVKISEKGKHTKDVLPGLLTDLVNSIHLPIAMRWGELDMQFIRPIHWLVCLLGESVIPFQIAGIKAGRVSDGHRFLGKRTIRVESVKSYEKTLATGYVLVDPEKRKAAILSGLSAIEKKLGLTVAKNDQLLEEVTFLNEWPEAVVAEIDEKYLAVPQECLIATMQKNQKYFPLLDTKGKLTKYFVIISNNATKKSKANIVSGNVKVVTARLEDAKFFYEEDKKVKMEHWVENLKKVTYQEKLGSIYGKIERIMKLGGLIAEKLGVNGQEKEQVLRVAFLCKADLDSKMVYEFPELQGIMGTYYAQAAGEDPIVAAAILDHWKPRFAGEDVSAVSKIAAIVSIADKMDSIAGCFSAGLIPSSSSDPYALRRAAQGIVAVILEKGFDVSIAELIEWGLQPFNAGKLQEDIMKFFKGRLKFVLQDKNIRYDLIDAVLAVPHADVFAAVHIGAALQKISSRKDFAKFVDTGVRVFRLSKEAKPGQIEEQYFVEQAEKDVYVALGKAEQLIDKALNEKRYTEVLTALFELVAPVDEFFVKVLVMDEDQHKRNNRLAILKRLDTLFKQVGDFEKIVV